MSKRKIRFNFVDLLILCVLVAVVFVVLYFFVWNKNEEQTPTAETVHIQYVVEVQGVDTPKHIDTLAKEGQVLKDAVSKKAIGTLASADMKPMRVIGFDAMGEMEDYISEQVDRALAEQDSSFRRDETEKFPETESGDTEEPSANLLESYSEKEGKICLYLTVEADAVESDMSFSIGGYEIRVGQRVSVLLPNFQGYGYCISMTELGR